MSVPVYKLLFESSRRNFVVRLDLQKFREALDNQIVQISMKHLGGQGNNRLFEADELDTKTAEELLVYLEEEEEFSEEQIEKIDNAIRAIVEEVKNEQPQGLSLAQVRDISEDVLVEFGKALVSRLSTQVEGAWGLGPKFLEDLQSEMVRVYRNVGDFLQVSFENNEIETG
jgi:hypothetical protein